MTAQFTAVGATSMLEAIRIMRPGIRFYQASSSEIFGATDRAPAERDDAVPPAHALRRREALRASSWSAPTASATACTRSSGILVQPRVAAAARRVRDAQGHPRRGGDQARAARPRSPLGNLDATRDWSYAGDFAEAMWLMLQQDAGGRLRDLRAASAAPCASSSETAFARVDLDPDEHVVRRPGTSCARRDPVAARRRPRRRRASSSAGWRDELRGHDRRDGRARPEVAPRRAGEDERLKVLPGLPMHDERRW